jgi:hypothetical protein
MRTQDSGRPKERRDERQSFPQELTLELEEHPEHLRDREDHLTIRDIQEERLSHPLTPFLQPFGMVGMTEPAGAAGEHQEAFRVAVLTADAGKPALRDDEDDILPP